MKSGLSVVLAVTFALVTAAADAETKSVVSPAKVAVGEPALKVIGPVESYDAKHGFARVLGQTVIMQRSVDLAVGDLASVVGISGADGKITASVVTDQGLYIAGSSKIFLSGNVQKINLAVGTATVNGVTIDFTSLLADSPTSPTVGTSVQVGGTQPAIGGVVLATAISGAGAKPQSISGGGTLNSISGGGSLNSISGGGTLNSISGGGSLNSISGGGKPSSISGGGGLNSISGGGTLNSISGGGSLNSISGGGKPSSISGGGGLNSISGGGTLNSISGGGSLNSISGGGKPSSISGGGNS
jgi:hypothetical protein